MNSDFQDWGELQKEATHKLRKKILGINPIIEFIVLPPDQDEMRIDLVEQLNNTYRLEKLSWKKPLDFRRMNNPLEKIKLFGRYNPTFERETYMINHNSTQNILNLMESIIKDNHQYQNSKRQIVLDAVQHELYIQYQGQEIHSQWSITPKQWKYVPRLTALLLDLTETR